jgi:NADP-dependent 3-hydroxy acid dehydrogenase YdfG
MALDGTVAVVTGASTGIGAAVAQGLAAAGCAVALVARRPEALAKVAATIAADGGTAYCIAADLGESGAPEHVVARTLEHLGRLDVLVNNAGAALVGPIVGGSREDWHTMVRLNLEATMSLSWAALPHLLEAAETGPRGVADLVTIASIAGRRPQTGAGVYAATKAAVCAFSESLRQEVTARNVRVGLVTPGAIRTDTAEETMRRSGRSTEAAEAPFMDVEDISGAVEYIVTRPPRMAVNEMILRPTLQVS